MKEGLIVYHYYFLLFYLFILLLVNILCKTASENIKVRLGRFISFTLYVPFFSLISKPLEDILAGLMHIVHKEAKVGLTKESLGSFPFHSL